MGITDKVLEKLDELEPAHQRLILELATALAGDDDPEPEYAPDEPFEHSICEYLRHCLRLREEQVADHLEENGIDPGGAMEQAGRYAEALVEATNHLGSKEHFLSYAKSLNAFVKDFDSFSEPKKGELVLTLEDCMDVVLARRVLQMLERARTRLEELEDLISLKIQISPKGLDFVRRVSTCYVYGLSRWPKVFSLMSVPGSPIVVHENATKADRVGIDRTGSQTLGPSAACAM